MGNTQGKLASPDSVSLSSFRLLRVVGKGSFGRVRIVEHRGTGLPFALKYIRKDEVVRMESVKNIIRERRMLEYLDHQFLCNLRYGFQDSEYIYLVVDLMAGGDLRFHITRKCFTEEAVRFWMAELACALRYIHSRGIIHRDVKPDNILLDQYGHAHLADFNVASDFRPSRPLYGKSGTMAYLAPEVFRGCGYFTEVDWWSLGVTFYECIYGRRPFDGSSHVTTVENVLRAQPKYHATSPAISMNCLNAMTSLLEKDTTKRIGAASFESFTTNPFFSPIDFQALERKELAPIFIPSSERTNFDASYDLEELLLEEAPLEARARRQRPRAELKNNATHQQIREEEMYRMMDTMFTNFNYTSRKHDTSAAEAITVSVNNDDNFPSSPSDGPPSSSFSPAQSVVSTSPPNTSPSGSNAESNPEDGNVLDHKPTQIIQRSERSYSVPLASLPPNHIPTATLPNANLTKSGGVRVVLEETGSWSNLADPSGGVSSPDHNNPKVASSGVFSFFNRKKKRGRVHKQIERGVLGKEGSRKILSG